ncbi:MAG: response regulator transcription factor [Lachnospiraceae bacterium]|jgi:DNA-binding response OmpR family regulator
MKILLVEDNPSIVKGLKHSLEKIYNTEIKTTYREAKDYILNNKTDLIILDVMLPDGNGFDLYKEIIKDKEIPTIFLTAKDDEDDIVEGLNLGADDYVTKPFFTKELIARINKAFIKKEKNKITTIGDISFDKEKLYITKEGTEIKLSPLELKITNLLFTNLNRVISRDIIVEKIWDWTGNYVDDHTVSVYIKRIRDKIGSDIITTVKGIGYRIDEEKK